VGHLLEKKLRQDPPVDGNQGRIEKDCAPRVAAEKITLNSGRLHAVRDAGMKKNATPRRAKMTLEPTTSFTTLAHHVEIEKQDEHRFNSKQSLSGANFVHNRSEIHPWGRSVNRIKKLRQNRNADRSKRFSSKSHRIRTEPRRNPSGSFARPHASSSRQNRKSLHQPVQAVLDRARNDEVKPPSQVNSYAVKDALDPFHAPHQPRPRENRKPRHQFIHENLNPTRGSRLASAHARRPQPQLMTIAL